MRAIYLFLALLFSVNIEAKIGAKGFFADPGVMSAHLSSDGSKVALVTNTNGALVIEIYDVEQTTRTPVFNFESIKKNDVRVLNATWLGSRYLALEIGLEVRGVENLLDTKRKVDYLIVDSQATADRPKAYGIQAKGVIIDPLNADDEHFLFSKYGANSRIYKLKVSKLNRYGKKFSKLDRPDGGQLKKKNQTVSVEGAVVRWFLAESGEVESVLYFKRGEGMRLAEIKKGEVTTEIHAWLTTREAKDRRKKQARKNQKAKKRGDEPTIDRVLNLSDVTKTHFVPVKKADTTNRFYGVNLESEDNIQTVYLIDYEKKEYKPVYESVAYRITDFEPSEDGKRLASVNLVMDGEAFTDYLDEDGNSTLLSSDNLRIEVGSSVEGNVTLDYVENVNNPGRYHLNKGGKETVLASRYPQLDKMAEIELVKSKIQSDDLEVEYFLTLPKAGDRVPLVVMPHGGPIGVFDSHYFDAGTRFLNEQGYAVLRVNYRGSGGYTKDFIDAGKKQFGVGILKDIVNATNDVLKRDDIDASSVCIAGMSYGGYAATMLTLQHPEIFKCGATVAGVSDVYLTANNTRLSSRQFEWVKEHIGDADTEKEHLLSISPVYLTENLSRPLLVVHGTKDKIVDIEHAYRLKYVLDKNQKDYEWLELENSGHQFEHESDLIQVFDTLATFLAKHL